ncbi:PAS-domain containing protein [Psychrosphaera sp. B3R10]|uniref:hybrid sensor histidine kinase/response regulator n=1 Tax=unclassified Psychrosphaera TaxID=2641570 RepID=UPI001C099FD9|nr:MULTISPECIES: PAS-domain containing protein [unclassified Psychrosphaera]MBU2882138.1 PAS-domain containing protein [Psychrosphaera sp. I2R16]MBU2988819.1 PAS-domain containing protein [Psychrosphaera sp. B3R10]
MFTWLSVDTWFIGLLSLGYLLLLFFIAYWGQQGKNSRWTNHPWIYSLSLGVSCTSWAFYGIIGQAATSGQWLAYIYYGTIACFILAWPMLLKMLRISKQQNLTSIADFVACRYDKSLNIAGIVTVIALLGTIPYIALQLRAISQSFDLVTGSYRSGVNTTIIVAMVLSVFSVLFGARHVVANKQNNGLTLAIAFSSIVKLLAITTVGYYITFGVFDGFSDLLVQQQQLPQAEVKTTSFYMPIAQIALGFISIFITPQLFHVMVIENHNEQQLKTARWLYPLFLILINLFVLPVAIAGQITFPGGSVNADTYILTLPLYFQQEWLSIFVYIGGLAAATSMVIVASIVLSTMVSTELITPSLLRFNPKYVDQNQRFSTLLLNFRRFAIVGILMLSLLFERIVDQQSHLSSIGILSFVLLAQFAPAVIGALYWRSASSSGALTGIVVGSCLWCYTLLLPTVWPNSYLVEQGLFGISWLQPTNLFGLGMLDVTSHGVFISLAINTLCFVLLSLNSRRSVGEKIQAEIFLKKPTNRVTYQLTPDDLYRLLNRFVSLEAANDLMLHVDANLSKQSPASPQLTEFARKKLASVLGSASTKLVMNAAVEDSNRHIQLEDVANIVDEASQLFHFNRELLQAGVENIEQGISIVDADMRLVAWNSRYIELLDYPKDLVKIGMPIQELIQFNAERKMLEGDDIETMVARRIEHMQAGNNHYFQRVLPTGVVLEIRGQAMPGGGFVSTFSDITRHIEAEKALQYANEHLERKVDERTLALSKAKAEAELANRSKTRFLAAASHDLMQPFNALSLFTDMLKQQVKGTKSETIAEHIQDSLGVVESLLTDLVEISKLEGGSQKIVEEPFAIQDVLDPLFHEFSLLAKQQNIRFDFQSSCLWVNSDIRLLRRIVQNYLSNAFHYSPTQKDGKQARVLIGVRRYPDKVQIQVWDNGQGIPQEKQDVIFQEFERLEQNRDKPGLGLGLTISKRIAQLLNIELAVRSVVGKGSVFSVTLPTCAPEIKSQVESPELIESNSPLFNGHTILVIDNDELLLEALKQQLESWGFTVLAIKDRQQWQEYCESKQIDTLSDYKPKLAAAIVDYHLDDGDNGIDFFNHILAYSDTPIPCIVCSADTSEQVREQVSLGGFQFTKKPVKSLALKKQLKQLLFN